MSIEEDVEKYFAKVERHLDELGKLSKEAGLFTHACVWYSIHAAFLEPEEFKTIIDMIKMYLDAVISREYKIPKEYLRHN